jgi:hypothetical protein
VAEIKANKVLQQPHKQLFLLYNKITMAHHHEENTSYDKYFYIAALLAGLFVGAIIGKGLVYIPVGGVLGLLSAVLFIKLAVRGRIDHEQKGLNA